MSLSFERYNSRRDARMQSFEYIRLTVAIAANVAPTVGRGFILDPCANRRKGKLVRGVRQRSFTQANVSFDEFSFWVEHGGAQSMQFILSAFGMDANKDTALEHDNMIKPLEFVELAKKSGS